MLCIQMMREIIKIRFYSGLTLLEMVIAMLIMAAIFAVLVPQLKALQNSWNSRAGSSEILQNGRVLIDHLQRSFVSASQITAVSGPAETIGYLEFQDYDEEDLRYEINGSTNYLEFGPVENLVELAGPVSKFQITCYDACDLDTPLNPVASPALVRCINFEVTFPNSSAMGQDLTLNTKVYLRTGSLSENSSLVGWWKLDDASGLTAVDSSVSENDGTLENMAGDEWTGGTLGGALEFDGDNDYVDLPIRDVIKSLTDCTITSWVNWTGLGNDWQRIWDFGSDEDENMYLCPNSAAGHLHFGITLGSWMDEDQTLAPDVLPTGWHHVAVTIDSANSTYTIYLDGQFAAENTSARYTPSDLGKTKNNMLGRSQYSADPYFNGIIDDVRIYNRVLEPEEIAQLYNVLRYCDFSEAKTSSDDTSLTISTPNSNEGDLLITAVATDGDTSNSIAPPSGEGWTEIDIDDQVFAVTLGAWWKLAEASESSSHEFTWSGDEQAYGWMMRFVGHDSANPINDWAADGQTSISPTSPAVTTTETDCLILRLGAFDDDNIIVDNPGLSGHTAITMDKSSGGSSITFQQCTETSVSWNVNSINISKPSGTVAGDLLIAAFVSDGDSTLSSPGGWTLIQGGGSSPTDNTPSLGLWYKIAGASEPATYTFSSSSWEELYIAILRYTGHNPGAPINASAIQNSTGNNGNSTPTAPSVTTTVDNCRILRIFGADDDDNPYTSPGGHTERYSGQSGGGNGTCGGAGADTNQLLAGATGTAAFSMNTSEEWRAITIAIAPSTGSSSDPVSGGAGYVSQSAIGNSGTSEFSLDSSNQAQMLTIAIAPDN